MIVAENVVKNYGEQRILNGLSLRIAEGEFVSVMGESGSGKSTLLSVLSGAMRPDSGKVFLDGKELNSLSDEELSKLRRTDIGFVYQFFNLIPTLTVEDNILLPIYLRKDNLNKKREELNALASDLRIDHLLKKYPDKISGGEQQRVAIARSVLYKPKVLMLDEPTGNLDSRARDDIMQLLVKLNSELNITIVQVTHSAETAKCGSRIIRMVDGTLADD